MLGWYKCATCDVSSFFATRSPPIAQGAIPFHDQIKPLTNPGQAMKPAHLPGRVATLRVPARTTPSSGVFLAMLGADQLVPGLIEAQSKGWSLGRNKISERPLS